MAYRCIVCGVTGSPNSQRAAHEAARLAKENGAGLVYVYAVDITFLQGGMAVQLPRKDVEHSLEHIGGHILDMAEAIAKAEGVSAKKVCRRGSILEVLKEVVKEEGADLLIVGHETRTFFERMLLKSGVEDSIEALKAQTGADVKVMV